MVALRKNLTVEKGETALFDRIRYFFSITNEWEMTCSEVAQEARQRCNQENLIAQLKGGVRKRSEDGERDNTALDSYYLSGEMTFFLGLE